jgi:U3 small nucleolar RNA-associated protein 21
MSLPSNVTQINLNRDSGLLAVVCDDLVVRLIDIETRRIVRELAGFKGRVLDLVSIRSDAESTLHSLFARLQTFSPDSRWLVAASLDSIVRTFDVPTGQLVDAFRTSSISTSVTFSPTGDFLATAQVDSVGVYLWANKAQFSEVALRHIDEDDITNVSMPSVHGTDDDAGEPFLVKIVND